MKCDKYMGIDLHQATTVVVVLGCGRQSHSCDDREDGISGNHSIGASLNGPLRVTFEETTQAGWLHDVVRGYVAEVTNCQPGVFDKASGTRKQELENVKFLPDDVPARCDRRRS